MEDFLLDWAQLKPKEQMQVNIAKVELFGIPNRLKIVHFRRSQEWFKEFIVVMVSDGHNRRATLRRARGGRGMAKSSVLPGSLRVTPQSMTDLFVLIFRRRLFNVRKPGFVVGLVQFQKSTTEAMNCVNDAHGDALLFFAELCALIS